MLWRQATEFSSGRRTSDRARAKSAPRKPSVIDHFIDRAQIVFCFAKIAEAAERRLLWAQAAHTAYFFIWLKTSGPIRVRN